MEPAEGPYSLPQDWQWARLGDVVKISDQLRRPINAKERDARTVGKSANDLVPYYGATGRAGWIDEALMEGDFVLLGEDGAPFFEMTEPKAYLISGPAWVNNHAHILSATDCVDLRFLLHALNATDYRPWVNGTTRLKLTQGAMREIPLPIPAYETQRRIVARIDELFAEIEEGERALAEARAGVETYRKALLKAAVTGELTADWRGSRSPTKDASAYLDLDDSIARTAERELPTLPTSWVWAPLNTILTEGPSNGVSPKSSADGHGTMTLKLTATSSGHMRLDQDCIKTLNVEVASTSNLFLKAGDLLFQRGNTRELVGIAAVYDGPPATFVYPDLMIRVRFASPLLSNWVWRWSNSPHGRAYLTSRAQGAAGSMPKISGETIRRMPVPIGPEKEMKVALERLDQGLRSVETPEQDALEIAGALKRSILAAAFRGELAA